MLALSDKTLVAGSNESAVEAAIKRSATGNSELASSENFRAAERSVSSPKQAFLYVDTALLYTRLDAAVRPILMMGAAFVPSINENVDMTKFPPAEVITKHLSPIVMSQNLPNGRIRDGIGRSGDRLSGCGRRGCDRGAAMFAYQTADPRRHNAKPWLVFVAAERKFAIALTQPERDPLGVELCLFVLLSEKADLKPFLSIFGDKLAAI